MKKNNEKGITILLAMIITASLLLVSTAIASYTLKESFLAVSSRESQYAFYAADTGMECAIYWDVKNPPGYSAFSTSTGSRIHCNLDPQDPNNDWIVGGSGTSTFTMTFLPDPYCTKVTVVKNPDNTTKIESQGYNTCDQLSPRRVERAVRVTY